MPESARKGDAFHELGNDGPILALAGLFHRFEVSRDTRANALLAIGLSKLSGVSFKESAFWVLGYWLLVKLALVVLA